LLKGWFKYISILPSETKQNFLENPEFIYEHSKVSDGDLTSKDEVGAINIPDRNSF